jgi:hypothetical protein
MDEREAKTRLETLRAHIQARNTFDAADGIELLDVLLGTAIEEPAPPATADPEPQNSREPVTRASDRDTATEPALAR